LSLCPTGTIGRSGHWCRELAPFYTTGTVTQVDGGETYVRTITTRGGVIVSDITG
jgi:hypothetical protein